MNIQNLINEAIQRDLKVPTKLVVSPRLFAELFANDELVIIGQAVGSDPVYGYCICDTTIRIEINKQPEVYVLGHAVKVSDDLDKVCVDDMDKIVVISHHQTIDEIMDVVAKAQGDIWATSQSIKELAERYQIVRY
ncbi:hypothetical protein NVP2117O_02 [Vibrio phage 2.117.O._10N.261.45.E9]|nr:hypothetical protein NVP1117O_02 [Vibrio phage 1.117.O._10N.261.45.E9]AUR95484.1 hypothetical protein NVP1207B_77 [Vibrio phage 1.207.B._10N.222.51.C2]AUS02294.1 hypothetical protein NVP2117O_02 [Vibrio phage 2.117.O._10N.261.45.E9]